MQLSRPPRPGSISIDGATGSNATHINGIFEPTDEICDGQPAYQKKGNETVWLEFYRESNYWFVRSTANRGTNKGWAYCTANGPCLPHTRPASTWKVYNGSQFETIPSFQIQLLSAPLNDNGVDALLFIFGAYN